MTDHGMKDFNSNDDCRRFRAGFSPAGEPAGEADRSDFHRRSCPACEAYARTLEAASEAPSMPAALAARLRTLPGSEGQRAACDDVDRLFAGARATARGGEGAPGLAAHLAACDRCRRLHAAVAVAFAETPPAAPPDLFARLCAVARRSRPPAALPAWLADGRWTAAACVLLAVLVTSVAGDASAHFQETTAVVSSRATEWADEGKNRGVDFWQELDDRFREGYVQGRERATNAAERLRNEIQDYLRKTLHPDDRTELEIETDPERELEGATDG